MALFSTDNIPHEPKDFFRWVIIFFIILWIVWFFTGGPQRAENKYKPYIVPLNEEDGGKVYSNKQQ